MQCRDVDFFSFSRDPKALTPSRINAIGSLIWQLSYLAGPKLLGKDRKMKERDEEEDERMKGKTEEPGIGQLKQRERERKTRSSPQTEDRLSRRRKDSPRLPPLCLSCEPAR